MDYEILITLTTLNKHQEKIMGYIMELRKELGHRPLIMSGAGAVIINQDDKILLLKRADNGYWGLPAGSMELGESFEACARREVAEETGIIMDKMELFTTESGPATHYIYPNGDEVYVAAVYYICREYHGEFRIQKDEVVEQRFFAVDEIPSDDILDPINKSVIDLAIRKLTE